jgi:hypothetical protein
LKPAPTIDASAEASLLESANESVIGGTVPAEATTEYAPVLTGCAARQGTPEGEESVHCFALPPSHECEQVRILAKL